MLIYTDLSEENMFGNRNIEAELENRLHEVGRRADNIVNHPNKIKRTFNKIICYFIILAFSCTALFIILPIAIVLWLISSLLRLQPNEADPRPLAIAKKVINKIFGIIVLLPFLLFVILISPLLLCFALVNYSETRELINIVREIGQLMVRNLHVLVGGQSTHDTQVNEHIQSAIDNLIAKYGTPSESFDEALLTYVKETKDFPIDVASKEIAEKIMQNQGIQARLNQSNSTEFTKVLVEAIAEAKSSNSSLRVYGIDFSSREIIDEIKKEKRRLVIKCLERIRQNNDTRYNLTLRQAINLIMTALEDSSIISDEERKATLIRHLLDIQTTYNGNQEACFVGSFNKIIETLDHLHHLVATPLGSDRTKQAAVYKAPVIVNELFKKQSESNKEVIREYWGDDEKASDVNKIYVEFLEEVKQEVKKRLDEEFPGIPNDIKGIIENLKYAELPSSNLTNTSIDYDQKKEMRKKYQIEVKDASEIRINVI